MIVLGLETCTPSGGVALLGDDGLLGVEIAASARSHSRLILPAAERLLAEAGLAWADVDAVAVSRGPGSFTGVRVGLAMAKGLCSQGHPRLVVVSSLEALARRALAGERVDAVVPVFNARLGEVFASAHSPAGECLLAEGAFTPEELIAALPAGRLLLAGDGAAAIAALLGDLATLARLDRRLPGPETVALLGRELAFAGRFTDPAAAAPVYLRDARVSAPKKRSTLGEG